MLDKLQQYEKAVASYDQAVHWRPDFSDAWFNRGVVLDKLQQYEKAVASYDQAVHWRPDAPKAWINRGVVLADLQRYEEAIASYNQAVHWRSNFPEAWTNRGAALHSLQWYEEAIASYVTALHWRSDNVLAWTNRGNALADLRRYEEAIASYDQALQLRRDDPIAWIGRGNALADLRRYEEAIASYDQALQLRRDDPIAWIGRGIGASNSAWCVTTVARSLPPDMQNSALDQRGYEGQLASLQEGLKYCLQSTHREGSGQLYQAIGEAHYFRGRRDTRPRSFFRKAVTAYNEALETLNRDDFPEQHLEVLRSLSRALLSLGETVEAKELLRQGSDLLQRLLADPSRSDWSKNQLALKFVGVFDQLTVDRLVQEEQLVQALKVAEEGKNACLSWLLSAWSDDIPKPRWVEIQQLLNPSTAVVYWHLSPAALTTFILKHNTPEPILITTPTLANESELPARVQHLREFENWVSDWNQQYTDYRKGKDKQGQEQNNWREQLPEMISQLHNILDIPTVESAISGITQLILIPHRDLHRFPLHALFPDDFTITYLPSAQFGITLQQLEQASHPIPSTQHLTPLLSVEHPNSQGLPSLEFAQIESEAISQMFPNPTRICSEQATKKQIETALPSGYKIFHFTGHGTYEFSNPALSHLALTGEEKLTIADICALDLTSYRVVCVSACETAITGNQSITTEYVGLVSGFMRCGVAHVVSTLWTVESAASALVMIQFYQLLKQGKPEAVALAEATQWLRNLTAHELEDWYEAEIAKLPEDEGIVRPFLAGQLDDISTMESSHQPYKDPYYWAAFTITGGLHHATFRSLHAESLSRSTVSA